MFLAGGAVLVASSSADARWRDRVYLDDGWYEMPYPPPYAGRAPVVVYPQERWRERVIRTRRGDVVIVEPDIVYGDPYLGEVMPEGGYYDDEVPGAYPDAPPPRRRVVVPAKPKAVAPKVIRKVAPPARPKEPTVAQVTLPVPRPNLEGMDFAPVASVPPTPAPEDRR